jgi:hypothetical protein
MPPAPKVPPPKLKTQLKTNRRIKAEALKELLQTFDEKWGTRLKPLETIKPLDKLNAVKSRICAIISIRKIFGT